MIKIVCFKMTLFLLLLSLPVYAGHANSERKELPKKEGSEMKNKHVLISGAGISGLTLAYWLKQYGFIPTLVERHPELRTGGYKIDIRGIAIEVVRQMRIFPAIFEARTDIQGATMIESGGKHSKKMDADLCGVRIEGDLEILRGDLCEIFLQQIGDVECLFGDCITDISQNEEGVYVEFEKGESRVFDLVIGADGLHSIVRQLVFGDEPEFLEELGIYISIYTIPNFLELDRWEIEYFEPQKFINVYSSSRDLNAKVGFAFSSTSLKFNPRNKNGQQKLLQEVFSELGWEVPRLLAAMKDAPDFYFDSVAQIHLPRWSKGRVALVGDAGYAPSPLSGQGTSVAIVGSYVLAGEIAAAQGDYKLAFSEYENGLRKFVKKNQELAEMSVALMTGKETSMTWLHHQLISLLPESVVIEFFKKLGVKRITEAANDLKLKKYHLIEEE